MGSSGKRVGCDGMEVEFAQMNHHVFTAPPGSCNESFEVTQ